MDYKLDHTRHFPRIHPFLHSFSFPALINGSLKAPKESVIAAPKGFIRGMQNNMGNNNVNDYPDRDWDWELYSPFAIAFIRIHARSSALTTRSEFSQLFWLFYLCNTSRTSSKKTKKEHKKTDTNWNRLTLFLLFWHYLNSKLIGHLNS